MLHRIARTLLVLAVALAAGCGPVPPSPLEGPPPPEPERAFRAAWIATVANIDWPSRPGLSTEEQQRELLAMLDRAKALNLNAIIFQVRPAADALYDSPLEPWSAHLTGTMGEAPVPFYDPLAFAVEEAHRRGLELHAWFNPYRAYHPSSKSTLPPEHVGRAHPEWVRTYGDYLWLDPGEKGAQEHVVSVIMDVVRRYDIDGVHFDDYFYPYKAYAGTGNTDFPDSLSYAAAIGEGTTLSRDDWRRSNVDSLVARVYREIKAEKPWVLFGISPFGIWRPGYPEGVGSFDAYDELYADARKWLRSGWVDYFTPQLYWRLDQANAPFGALLDWWAGENIQNRHLWPGLFTSRVLQQGEGAWSADDILNQIRRIRATPGASGEVHFSMKALMGNADGLAQRLLDGPYAQPALIPAAPWLSEDAPQTPEVPRMMDGVLALPASPDGRPWLWVIRTRKEGVWAMQIVSGEEAAVALEDRPEVVLVSAVDRYGNESGVARAARAGTE